MTLNRLASALIAVFLVAPALFAAEDLTGKWSGSFIITMDGGDPHEDVAHMVAKHTGADFAGSVGPNPDQQWPILKGKVETIKADGKETQKITFDVLAEGGDGGPTLHFELELIAGHLKGKAKAEHDGRTMSAVIDLARVK